MKRYNIFYMVHKGLRALLFDTAICIQQTDFKESKESDIALQKIKDTLELFDKHANTEDNHIFSLLDNFEPSVILYFEEEHVLDYKLSANLKHLVSLLEEAESAKDRNDIGLSIQTSFISFLTFNLEHMAKEEDTINKLLWRYYSDEELQNVTEKIISAVPPELLTKYNQWMMRGLNNSEIIKWLKAVKNTAPEFIFQSLLSLALLETGNSRWGLIREQLTEGALLAE